MSREAIGERQWDSRTVVRPADWPGLELVIAKMSFGRRIELMRRVRDLGLRLEYFEAGQDARNGMEASILGAEIDRLYVLWGLEEIRGLVLDGAAATAESLIERGPEELLQAAVVAIRAECGAERDRKKKLIVAFHFVLANSQSRVAEHEGTTRAGWDCGSCRRHGLEVKRRCGFLPEAARGEPRAVWGRKHARSEECPRSLMTGESLALVEEFFVCRRLGTVSSTDLEARKVDAFLILRDEMEREERDGTSQH